MEKRARYAAGQDRRSSNPGGTAVSLTTIVVFALGYVAVLTIVMCMLVVAKRDDASADGEYDALVRSMNGDFEAPERPAHDPHRTPTLLRHGG